jgi:2-oxoglutarate dehydrogenase E2 component (dihydrolipoamide succinyltransferase)
MTLIDMLMPKMGESIHEATVLTWLKKPGDRVELDDPLLEVATDKVDTEVPSTQAGVLREILVPEGDIATIGKPLCRFEADGDGSTPAPTTDATPQPEEAPDADVLEIADGLEAGLRKSGTPKPAPASTGDERFYSPLVLNICKEEGISAEELKAVPGTGADGRVTKNDILTYVEQRRKPATPVPATRPAPAPSNGRKTPPVSVPSGDDELVQMDRMRRMIADRMVESKRTAPHVTSFVETDMTPLVRWRERMKGEFKKQYGENLTFTPLLLEAVVKAIKAFPAINASVEGDAVRIKRAINIGLAVALPNGNLIVPVIHEADQYNLVGLTRKVNDLSRRARENALQPDDLTGGTYTVSNIGTFGNLMGTPIILQPQVAIMAFGVIQKKPAVIETPEGDLIGIRHKMFISHSYDHRVVDGSLGGQFVKRVSDELEQFDPERPLV